MPTVNITLSANAGVSIRVGQKNIWVDALFEGIGNTFSSLPANVLEGIMSQDALGTPDHIVFTHCHGDHYSKKLAISAMEKWPAAKMYLPLQELEGQALLAGKESCVEDGNLQLRFLKLPHAGEIYADVALYGLLISVDGCNILLPGDCEIASPALVDAIGDTKIDLVVLDFPWITKRVGKEFLLKHIKADHVVAYHLPFAEDDVNGFRGSAARAAESLREYADVRLLWDPLQEEQINI